MTDKEKKSKIADILLEFYDEYQCNMPNRPMIPSLYASKIIDSMQEEPVSEELNTESMIESYKQRLISQSNGVKNSPLIDMCLASYKHGINDILDTLNLFNTERIEKNWKVPVSEDLEEAAKNYMRSQNPPIWGLYYGFKAGAQWHKKQMTLMTKTQKEELMVIKFEFIDKKSFGDINYEEYLKYVKDHGRDHGVNDFFAQNDDFLGFLVIETDDTIFINPMWTTEISDTIWDCFQAFGKLSSSRKCNQQKAKIPTSKSISSISNFFKFIPL